MLDSTIAACLEAARHKREMRAALDAIGCRLHVDFVLSLARVARADPPLIMRDVGNYHSRILEEAELVTIDREGANRGGYRVTATDAGRELVGRVGG